MRRGRITSTLWLMDGLHLYRESARERCLLTAARTGARVIDAPGIVGVGGAPGGERAMLLVTDDGGYGLLREQIALPGPAVVRILASAARCERLVAEADDWISETSTAMLCADLSTLTPTAVPDGFAVRRIDRGDGGRPTLREAVDVAMVADPTVPGTPVTVLAQLRAMGPTYEFFAAVDEDHDTVVATSASGRFGRFAAVSFVTTAVSYRRRGLGTALTAHALLAARSGGARAACLEASADGASVYRSLGFRSLGALGVHVRV